jgi:hypothetical protein
MPSPPSSTHAAGIGKDAPGWTPGHENPSQWPSTGGDQPWSPVAAPVAAATAPDHDPGAASAVSEVAAAAAAAAMGEVSFVEAVAPDAMTAEQERVQQAGGRFSLAELRSSLANWPPTALNKP